MSRREELGHVGGRLLEKTTTSLQMEAQRRQEVLSDGL